MLKVLHDGAPSGGVLSFSNSHHVYLALIVILILSEDEFFCKIVHETVCLYLSVKFACFCEKLVQLADVVGVLRSVINVSVRIYS